MRPEALDASEPDNQSWSSGRPGSDVLVSAPPRRSATMRAGLVAAVVLGATALVGWHTMRAGTPTATPASLRAVPVSPGLLPWAPRGNAVGDDGFIRASVATLLSSGRSSRPSTALHLLYAGQGITVVEGMDSSGRPALAEIAGRRVVADHLGGDDPAALSLPEVGGVRFLVRPYDQTAVVRAYVWVASPGADFSRQEVDTSGLTEARSLGGQQSHFVLQFQQTDSDSGALTQQVIADGVAVSGRLYPRLPDVRLIPPPWPVLPSADPSAEWLADAGTLVAAPPVAKPVRVASLGGTEGFLPAASVPGTTPYRAKLYAITDAHDTTYLGIVVARGGQVVCSKISPAPDSLAELPALGEGCRSPGDDVGALLVVASPDATDVAVAFPATTGAPRRQAFPSLAGSVVLIPVTALSAKGSVTLTARSARSGKRYELMIPHL